MNTYREVKTKLIDDKTYVELSIINNVAITFLMVKSSEPNNFKAARVENGDHVDKFIEEYNKEEKVT